MTNGDLISRSALLEVYERLVSGLKDSNNGTIAGFIRAITKHIKLAPAVDAVSRSVFEQFKWERDCAIQQLKDHGIPFGGIAPDVVEVVRCRDCKHEEDCMKQLVFWERDHVLEQNVYQYHKLDFCSYGERKQGDTNG